MCGPLEVLTGGLLGSLFMRPRASGPINQTTTLFEKPMNTEASAGQPDDLTPSTGTEGIAKSDERRREKVSSTGALRTGASKAPKQIGLSMGGGGRQRQGTGINTGTVPTATP